MNENKVYFICLMNGCYMILTLLGDKFRTYVGKKKILFAKGGSSSFQASGVATDIDGTIN